MAPYIDFSDKLWPPNTKLGDKLWPPYTNFSDNRHKDFEVKVKNEGENEVFQTFDHVHRDPEVFLHHICRDKLSLDSPFNHNGFQINCVTISSTTSISFLLSFMFFRLLSSSSRTLIHLSWKVSFILMVKPAITQSATSSKYKLIICFNKQVNYIWQLLTVDCRNEWSPRCASMLAQPPISQTLLTRKDYLPPFLAEWSETADFPIGTS